MALKKEQLKRRFVIDNRGNETTLPDPNPDRTPEEVMSFYSATYPELTNANVFGPSFNKHMVEYKFKTTVGVKG